MKYNKGPREIKASELQIVGEEDGGGLEVPYASIS